MIARSTLMMLRLVLLSHFGVIVSFTFHHRVRQVIPIIGTSPERRFSGCFLESPPDFLGPDFCRVATNSAFTQSIAD